MPKIKNKSGLVPVEYKLVIRPEKIEKITKGGIYIPPAAHERSEYAQTRGVIIALGGNVFEDWKEPIPKVGDNVYFAQYAGEREEGTDKEIYLIINDKDIKVIIQEKGE